MTTSGLDNQIQAQWARIRGKLRAEFGESAYSNWLRKLTLADFDRGEIKLAAPTRFIRDWISNHYADRLLALWAADNSSVRRIVIETGNAARSEKDGAKSPRTTAEPRGVATDGLESNPKEPSRVGMSVALDPRFTFEEFVVAKPNELAYTAARRVAESKNVLFNPLFLYGGVGLGKTHLMHAIAWHIRKRHPERRVLYMSAEKFMYQFVRALRDKSTMAFKEAFRSVDVLM
ncbi:MAG: DnaA ATPase domain-containing protein, partial [Dongiaceae bacterium]